MQNVRFAQLVAAPPLASGSNLAASTNKRPAAPPPRRKVPAYEAGVLELFDSDDELYDTPPQKRRKQNVGNGGGEARAGGDKAKGKGKAVMEALDLEDEYGHLDPRDFLQDKDGDLLMDLPPVPPARGAPPPLQAGPKQQQQPKARFASVSPPRTPAAANAPDPIPAVPAAGPSSSAGLSEAAQIVCSILPDVLPSYVNDLLELELYGPGNVELVLEALFGMEGKYPKREEEEEKAAGAGAKGKGKERVNVEEDAGVSQEEEDAEIERKAKQWVETSGRKAGGKTYEDAALAQLYLDFPSIQQINIKKLFSSSSSFYTTAYLAAEKALKQTEAERGFRLMAGGGRARKEKGKGRSSDEFDRERKWVVEELPRYLAVQTRAADLEAKLEAEIVSGAFFECGCCFTDCALSQMTTCDEGCHFCKDCARMNAESQIGMRKYLLPCMSTSGCTSTFSEREAERFLNKKSLAALHKIRMEKEVGAAEIEGLEQCPFCPFAYIIENPDERLFHCQRQDCKIISCRQCKKKNHLPQTCKEVDEDAKISTVHRVEEAMSAALIRRCPKDGCGEPYIKENGTCNKIICSSCRTLSCYICNQVIDGYGHFKNAGSNAPGGGNPNSQCVLWDDSDSRNFQEVEAARLAAEAQARKENPGVTDEDLRNLAMDKPKAPPGVIAHMAAPRIAAYEALVNQGLAGALDRYRAGPAALPNDVQDLYAGVQARMQAARDRLPPAPYVPPPPMPAYANRGYGAAAAAQPPAQPLNAANLAMLAHQGRVGADEAVAAAERARRAERDRLLREAQERRRQAEVSRQRREVEARNRAERDRKRRRDQEDARAARRARTGGGKR
ncbi:hypothetical protein JCM11641_008168 [Rhodosporidiobolus odoratus]